MMHRTLLGIYMFFIIPSLAGQLTETGKRVSLTDGNELYSWCQAYKETIRMTEDEIRLKSGSTASMAFAAGNCTAYIRGIVDSLPAGEGFDPGPHVRLTQYVDVVFKYLDEHPESRDKQAAILVTKALVQAFPKN